MTRRNLLNNTSRGTPQAPSWLCLKTTILSLCHFLLSLDTNPLSHFEHYSTPVHSPSSTTPTLSYPRSNIYDVEMDQEQQSADVPEIDYQQEPRSEEDRTIFNGGPTYKQAAAIDAVFEQANGRHFAQRHLAQKTDLLKTAAEQRASAQPNSSEQVTTGENPAEDYLTARK